MPLKDISYLEFWQHLRSFEQNHLCNFGRSHHEKKLCEMVLNLNSGSGDVVLRYFLSRALAALLLSGAESFV